VVLFFSFLSLDRLLAKGSPMGPAGCLTVGSIISFLGLTGVIISFLPKTRYEKLRLSWRGGSRMSRISMGFFAFFFVVFGSFMIADGGLKAITFSPGPYLFGAFWLAFAGAAFDAFTEWKTKGFPVHSRCPNCGRSVDFKLNGTNCRCGRKIG
jgi:hypothetical protein